jgi:ABC-type glycerol-3-phosphate transport system permease component
MTGKRRTGRIGLAVFLVLVCTFSLFPFLWMVITSVKEQREIMSIPPTLVPSTLTAGHYGDVFTKSNMPRYFINSTIIATGSTVIALVFSILGGYGFARFRFRGRAFLQNAVLSSQMLPTAAIIVPVFIILRTVHLLNSDPGLILAYLIITMPLSVWMMTGYFRFVPAEIEEAALIDGCSRLGVLTRVVLPVSLPGLVATAVYCFVVTWNEFLFALSFATDRRVMTLPIGLMEFSQEFTTDWGALMAGSVLMTLPIVILFFVIQRAFISGLTSGATKG